MREHSVNNLNNFICGWYSTDTSVCDKLIEYHKNSNDKVLGKSSDGFNMILDTTIKDSVDVF